MNFSDDDVPEFADVVPDTGNLEGDKMPIEDILNLPLIFTGWEISKSKYRDNGADSRCLTLQFIFNGVPQITFTGSGVLMEQIEKFEAALQPQQPRRFRATIRKIQKFYKFCRTDSGDKGTK